MMLIPTSLPRLPHRSTKYETWGLNNLGGGEGVERGILLKKKIMYYAKLSTEMNNDLGKKS